MSREETRKHLCTKHRNNPVRNDGKGKEILYVPRGREVNADANGESHTHKDKVTFALGTVTVACTRLVKLVNTLSEHPC